MALCIYLCHQICLPLFSRASSWPLPQVEVKTVESEVETGLSQPWPWPDFHAWCPQLDWILQVSEMWPVPYPRVAYFVNEDHS